MELNRFFLFTTKKETNKEWSVIKSYGRTIKVGSSKVYKVYGTKPLFAVFVEQIYTEEIEKVVFNVQFNVSDDRNVFKISCKDAGKGPKLDQVMFDIFVVAKVINADEMNIKQISLKDTHQNELF